MVELTPIKREELRALIELSFKGDAELMDKYHIKAPCTLDEAVNNTHAIIDPFYEHGFWKDKIQAFALTVNDVDNPSTPTKLGFTVIALEGGNVPERLFSFGLNIKHRNRHIVSGWFNQLDKVFGGKEYYTQLHDRNTRAIDFLEKNNFKTTQCEGYKKLNKCH